ncbi:MAG: glycosyltransferase family 4 protein [bacterium]|nr:glycosyltransferase family 4 protein [bacterium]
MRIFMIGQKGIGDATRFGGIEEHVRQVSLRLLKAGHAVRVAARRRYYAKPESHIDTIPLVYLPTIPIKGVEAGIHAFVATLHVVLHPYDIVHYHGVGASTFGALVRLFRPKTTVIATFHARDALHAKWGLFGRMYLRCSERASVLFPHYTIAVSHEIQMYCRETFGKQVVYIPNGAEIVAYKKKDLDQALAAFSIKSKEYILFVGRLVPEKGLHYLIEAFRRLRTTRRLVLVGDTSDTARYVDALFALADGDDRIRFLGRQPHDVVEKIFAGAYLYVHPSDSEGLPVVVLEAMAAGVMPLVSDIAGNKEAIKQSGETFKKGDVDDLTKKLQSLLRSTSRVHDGGEEARAIVEHDFSWDKVAEQVEGVYLTARH